eukprot:scaffold6857_cov125-Isochrysis_galbana.AAC.4
MISSSDVTQTRDRSSCSCAASSRVGCAPGAPRPRDGGPPRCPLCCRVGPLPAPPRAADDSAALVGGSRSVRGAPACRRPYSGTRSGLPQCPTRRAAAVPVPRRR